MSPLFPGIRIEAAELRLVRLPLLTPFVISTGTMTEKVFPLLTLKAEGLDYLQLRALGTPKAGRDAARKGDVATMQIFGTVAVRMAFNSARRLARTA